jgi:tripartite-type tricarboxylate transporter receptor subunit TctC
MCRFYAKRNPLVDPLSHAPSDYSPPTPCILSRMKTNILPTGAWITALALFTTAAFAQSWPTRPIRLIVPYGGGSAPDVIARVVAEELGPRLGQPIVVENRLGAGGKIGTEVVARAAPDGYTLLLGSKDTHGVMQHLYPKWEVDPIRDFAPISLLVRIQNTIAANKDLPASTLPELIALAKSRELNYGTPGIGTNLHLLAELLKQAQGMRLTHVPYKTFAEIIPSAMRNEIQLAVLGVPPITPFARDGRVKVIAVTGTARSKFLPNVPTFTEAGVAGFEQGGWFALFAPAKVPPEAIARLTAETQAMGARPSFGERVEKMFAEAATSTPAELAALVATETARWGEVVRKAGVTLE